MDIQQYITTFLGFINDVLVPFILAIALLFFLWNLTRYFLIQGGSDEARTKAKRATIYGILAFFIIAIIWGLVNLLVTMFGFGRPTPLCPDYFPGCEAQSDPYYSDFGDGKTPVYDPTNDPYYSDFGDGSIGADPYYPDPNNADPGGAF